VVTSNSIPVTLLPKLNNLSLSVAIIDPTTGNADGEITLDVSEGSGDYLYAWSNGENTSSITGLTTGEYSCTVSDATGCVPVVIVTETIGQLTSTTALSGSASVSVFPNLANESAIIAYTMTKKQICKFKSPT